MDEQETGKVIVLPRAKLQLDRKHKLEILKVLRSHDPEIAGLSFEYGSKGELREIRVKYSEQKRCM
jgi:hypothetical protein